MSKTEDNVKHPKHYTQNEIETWDFLKYFDYLTGSAMKYLCRYKFKGKAIEDLEKSKCYIDKIIEEERRKTKD